jgi:hypothetical protein
MLNSFLILLLIIIITVTFNPELKNKAKKILSENFIASIKDKQKIGTSETEDGLQPKASWKSGGLNYESCYNTSTQLGNAVGRKNGVFCDFGVNGGELVPSKQLSGIDLSNYNLHYGKIVKGKKLTGQHSANGVSVNLSNDGYPLGQTLTLEQAKRLCDGLGKQCAGFYTQVKTKNNIVSYTYFISELEIGFEDPDTYSKKIVGDDKSDGYFISYVKKDLNKMANLASAITETGRNSNSFDKYNNMATCDWRSKSNCILRDYKLSNNGVCADTTGNGNPEFVVSNYNENDIKSWLTALYNRDIGKDKSRSEAANIYEYAERCKDVPGYEFLRGLNFTNPNPPLATKADISGRYVRITTNNLGDNVWLQLAEVVVLRNGVNIALNKPSNAKTVGFGGEPRRANDGNADGNYNNNSVYHSGVTDGRARGPEYWEVDLGSEELIDRIIVYNRTDCCSGRMVDWLVTISNNSKKPVWNRIYPVPPNPKTMIEPRASNNDMRNPLIKNYEVNKFNEYFTKVKNQNLYVAKVGWEGHCAEQCHIDICQNAGKKWIGNNNWYACRDLEEIETKFKFVPVYSKGSFGNLDRGKEIVDNLFAQNKIFMRECTDCYPSHRVVYYKRISHNNNFSMYENIINTWSSSNNVLNVDFKLYSSFDDLLNDRNPWQFCNYNDPGIGFPRDCGPYGGVPWQWNSSNRGGQPNVKYSVLADPNSVPKESACQKHTRENTCNKRFPWWFSKTCCVGETPVCFNGSYWYPLKEPGSGYTWHTEGWLNPCDGPVRKCLPERCGY